MESLQHVEPLISLDQECPNTHTLGGCSHIHATSTCFSFLVKPHHTHSCCHPPFPCGGSDSWGLISRFPGLHRVMNNQCEQLPRVRPVIKDSITVKLGEPCCLWRAPVLVQIPGAKTQENRLTEWIDVKLFLLQIPNHQPVKQHA